MFSRTGDPGRVEAIRMPFPGPWPPLILSQFMTDCPQITQMDAGFITDIAPLQV